MKTSLNWLKQYIDTDLNPEDIGALLTSIGLEVEGMEEIEQVKGGLKGVVTGKVLSCQRHPNADRLSLTTVDIGQPDPLHIVCGAPNVAAGQMVLVATVGTTLYPTSGDPITLKKGKIRGEESNGMICAEDELGLGHSHEGILVLAADTPVGMPAAEYFQLSTDIVYEIGLTPNRSDATNHLGVARDLRAALAANHGYTAPLRLPDVSSFAAPDHSLPIQVAVPDTTACPRYAGLTIAGLTIGDSPDWLKQRLQAVGVRPINNVVDVTNFVLHELGQPLHAFDYDAIADQKIIVQTLPANTPFISLDEVERSLHADDLMICDGQHKPMCMGGIFGGAKSGVTATTTCIFLESAHFNPKFIRRSSMRHNLRTDAAKIFEKGSDPNMVVFALKRAAHMICELAGGHITSPITDLYPQVIEPVQIPVRFARINQVIGMELDRTRVLAILQALEMDIINQTDDSLLVAVPTNKADVLREIDIIEEILRIHGFNNVPAPGRLSASMAIAPEPDPVRVRNLIADMLTATGFHEMMGLSLSESRYYRDILPLPDESLVYVNHTANVQLDILRPEMVFTGLEAIVRSQNRQESDLRLFEFGRTYKKEGDVYIETNRLALYATGRRWAESWLTQSKNEENFFSLKGAVKQILDRLGVVGYQAFDYQDDRFAYALQYRRGQQVLVTLGSLQPKLLKAMDAKGKVMYADFNWDTVFEALPSRRLQFRELNKFPLVRRDLALVVDNSVKFSDIATAAAKTEKQLLRSVNLFDVYTSENQLGPGKKSYAVSFVFENPEKTLQDHEIDKVMNKLIDVFATQLQAQVRR
jgi:phenylalanyl-tRNA synthetase beta chain